MRFLSWLLGKNLPPNVFLRHSSLVSNQHELSGGGGDSCKQARIHSPQILSWISIFLFSVQWVTFWPYILIRGEQISSTSAQIETRRPSGEQREAESTSNVYECKISLGFFTVLTKRIEDPDRQEAVCSYASPAGVFIFSEKTKAPVLVEMPVAA